MVESTSGRKGLTARDHILVPYSSDHQGQTERTGDKRLDHLVVVAGVRGAGKSSVP